MVTKNYVPRLHVEHLGDNEVRYELAIRKLFLVTDNKNRRRRKLTDALNLECVMTSEPEYESPYEFTVDLKSVQAADVKECSEYEGVFTAASIKEIESPVVHLMKRLNRMNVPEDGNETYNSIKVAVDEILARIVDVYEKLNAQDFEDLTNDTNGDVPEDLRHTQAPTNADGHGETSATGSAHTHDGTANDNSINGDMISRLTEIINASVAKAIQEQMGSVLPEHMRNVHSNFVPVRNGRTNLPSPERVNPTSHRVREPNWYDNDTLFEDNERLFMPNRPNAPLERREEFRSSSHTGENRIPATPISNSNSRSIFEWNFHYSGLESCEDPKGLEIESFIMKIVDYSKSEQLTEPNIMSKVQHLLKGPAATWYSHAQKSIFTWKSFTRKLRDRFSTISNVDTLRQQIYSKRQQPGENTMRFIDDFVNLIDQLPEIVTERQAVEYILKGIRTEVARLARTAKVQTTEELSKFIKSNFGLKDRMHDRTLKNQLRFPSGKKVEQLDELTDECYSDESDECEIEVHELKRANEKKKKVENKNVKNKKPIKNPHTLDKPLNPMPKTRNEHFFQCCCNARNTNQLTHTYHNNRLTQTGPEFPYDDQPNSSQVEMLNQTPQRLLTCPFCGHNHSYRDSAATRAETKTLLCL